MVLFEEGGNTLKKYLMVGACAATLLISACAKDEAGLGDEDQQALRGNDMEIRNTRTSEEQQSTQFGYVRYDKKQLNQDQEQQNVPMMDREATANMITRTLLKLNGIEEAATLVTDDATFVAYTKSEDAEQEWAADTVKRTALSMLPSWFDVYISDQPTAYEDLQALGNNKVTEADDKKAIDNLKKRFRSESPQGQDPKNYQHNGNGNNM